MFSATLTQLLTQGVYNVKTQFVLYCLDGLVLSSTCYILRHKNSGPRPHQIFRPELDASIFWRVLEMLGIYVAFRRPEYSIKCWTRMLHADYATQFMVGVCVFLASAKFFPVRICRLGKRSLPL